MAKQTQKAIELQDLVRKSEAARLEIGRARQALKRKLDVPSRIKESLKAQPTKWIGGSILVGFVASVLFRPREKKVRRERKSLKKRKSSLPRLLRLFITLSQPAVKIYATKLLKDYLENQLTRGRGKRPPLV